MDVGSNAIRFTAAEHRPGQGIERLSYSRVPIRLGHDAFRTGRLTEENLDAAIGAMVDFRRRLDRHRIVQYRAVATSAVRDAANGVELVEGARREADIDLEVIDGREEARLVWRATPRRLFPAGDWVLVDLGGGSMEISTGRGDEMKASETFPLGTVRLLERVEGRVEEEGDPVEEALLSLEGKLAAALGVGLAGSAGVGIVMLAAGGNIEALARLAAAPRTGMGGWRLSLESLERVTAELGALSLGRRVEELGLRPDRADVIVPAGRLYGRVAELAGVPEIVVPGVSVSDGILLEEVEGSEPGSHPG